MAAKKEITRNGSEVVCAVCARTVLKGERTEAYIAAGERKEVCDLCRIRVEEQGWIRESVHSEMPRRHARDGNRRMGGLRAWLGAGRKSEVRSEDAEALHQSGQPEISDSAFAEFDPDPEVGIEVSSAGKSTSEGEPQERLNEPNGRASAPAKAARRNPRSIRGVPVEDAVKVDRALDLFNTSEHPRTVAGIARTLGEPQITVVSRAGTPSEVQLVVAWELSWYKYVVDLGDAADPVHLQEKGYDLDEIPAELQLWNAQMSEDGQVEANV